MRKKILGLLAFILASAVAASWMFSGIVIGPAPDIPVEFDVNVQNTPLPVEVTNPSEMPIAVNYTAIRWFDHDSNATGLNWGRHSQYTDVFFDSKTVVFTGGSIAGHLVFTSDNGVGSVPAAADLRIDTTTALGQRIAFPFSSMMRIENVTNFRLSVWVYHPVLPGDASYYYEFAVSVFWYIEE